MIRKISDPVPAPEGLSVIPVDDKVLKVSWKAVPDPRAKRYRVSKD